MKGQGEWQRKIDLSCPPLSLKQPKAEKEGKEPKGESQRRAWRRRQGEGERRGRRKGQRKGKGASEERGDKEARHISRKKRIGKGRTKRDEGKGDIKGRKGEGWVRSGQRKGEDLLRSQRVFHLEPSTIPLA
jgi:hypothetical protein